MLTDDPSLRSSRMFQKGLNVRDIKHVGGPTPHSSKPSYYVPPQIMST